MQVFFIQVLEFVGPGNCKSFTLKTGSLHAQVLFNTDFTVVPKVGQLLSTVLFENREPLNLGGVEEMLRRFVKGRVRNVIWQLFVIHFDPFATSLCSLRLCCFVIWLWKACSFRHSLQFISTIPTIF
jgi:hypothetical protein